MVNFFDTGCWCVIFLFVFLLFFPQTEKYDIIHNFQVTDVYARLAIGPSILVPLDGVKCPCFFLFFARIWYRMYNFQVTYVYSCLSCPWGRDPWGTRNIFCVCRVHGDVTHGGPGIYSCDLSVFRPAALYALEALRWNWVVKNLFMNLFLLLLWIENG
jgi:hypothetical protein